MVWEPPWPRSMWWECEGSTLPILLEAIRGAEVGVTHIARRVVGHEGGRKLADGQSAVGKPTESGAKGCFIPY